MNMRTKHPARTEITIFSVPKPFRGQIDVIQRNAIQSWLKLNPKPEIILMGDEEGVADISREFNLRHLPELETNEFGTPLISSIFESAQAIAENDLLAYVNTDIILFNDFNEVPNRIPEETGPFLVTGRRWDLRLWDAVDFEDDAWDEHLKAALRDRGLLHTSTGVDYYLFRRGLYKKLIPLALGRTCWDNWLLWYARSQNAALIDATAAVTVIHQEHDYNHVEGGALRVWLGEEAERNRKLTGGDLIFVSGADYAFDKERLIPYSSYRSPEELTAADNARIKVVQAKEALDKGLVDECRDLLTVIESLFREEPRFFYYLKARLALHDDDGSYAVSALKKELERYPDNGEAAGLLARIGKKVQDRQGLT